jgi:glycosyltransferase involved in cell wall biosynthesis
MDTQTNPSRSLVIPIYKNELNLPDLLKALRDFSRTLSHDLEVVFVVDGSPDRCFELLRQMLPEQPYSSQLLELSRNFGSFSAIRSGLEIASGRFFAVMAADLQEPIHLIHEFFDILEQNSADVVFGQRTGREDTLLTRLFSKIFWGVYRRVVMPDIPSGGVDIFACNHAVRETILTMGEVNTSLLGQLFWIGYKRRFVPYRRLPRKHGKSAWNLTKKMNYMLDSIFSFSDLPIQLLLILGTISLLASLVASFTIFIMWFLGRIAVPGYTPIMLALLTIGSVLIIGQGIIGAYAWRILANTQRRPLFIVSSHLKYSKSYSVQEFK